jgi:hypothetical protein
MLYQLHNENGKDVPQVVRFGSKSLSKWQQSYGPTKLAHQDLQLDHICLLDYPSDYEIRHQPPAFVQLAYIEGEKGLLLLKLEVRVGC